MATTCNTDICKRLVELMKLGWTQEEVCAELGYTSETFIEWRNPDGKYYEPEFAQAYKRAKTYQKAWWDRFGREHMADNKINTALYALFRANLHRWGSGSDKNDALRKMDDRARRIEKRLGISSEDDE